MQDLYLKFPDQGTAEALIYDQVPSEFDAEGNVLAHEPRQKFLNTDILGTIYEGGEWDAEGNQIAPPTPLPGWHVNIRLMPGEDASKLMRYAVIPTTPRRVWA